MAAWMRLSSPFLCAFETASSSAKLKVSSFPRLSPPLRPARVRPFSASASKAPAGGAAKPARPPTGIMKPRPLSPEMQKFLGGVPEAPRTEALKQIWAYIKQNNLQDPANKKIIICDEKLKTIFAGKDRVGFLEVAGLISPHFPK